MREESSASHEERIARAASGDPDALSELLAEFGPVVESGLAIHRRWRGLLDASDVMQVTYLEAFLAMRSPIESPVRPPDQRQPRHFLAWLRRLAENNLSDAVRALSRRKRSAPRPPLSVASISSDDSREVLLETLIATTSTPSRSVRRDEAFSRLDRAIARLPTDYATVIRAHDLQGASIEGVAQQMGRSLGAVHMLRARALHRLADLLTSTSEELSLDRRIDA